MKFGLLTLVIVAATVVILSGVWVAVALIRAAWRVDQPASSPTPATPNESAE
ncbi:MAG TPA: hypothetical protein PKH24_08065 [Sedimentisphaerales bacterium]|jgi:hypothetical protein|nr:hypothetical protein [Sedimentisphaerales bacterium]HNU28934.1 hypothetical protein [Sedimentisphaerales bacterium]